MGGVLSSRSGSRACEDIAPVCAFGRLGTVRLTPDTPEVRLLHSITHAAR